MKTNILRNSGLLCILWLVCATGYLPAQKKQIRSIDDLFSAYEQVKGVGYISLSPSLFLSQKAAESKELDEVFASIASLRIINMDITPESEPLANRLRADVSRLVKQDNFEEMMRMREDDSDFVVYLAKNTNAKNNNTELEALLLIADEKAELVLIGISGKITRKVIDAVMEGKIGVVQKK